MAQASAALHAARHVYQNVRTLHMASAAMLFVQAGGSWAGGAVGSGAASDSTSRAMQRLKDMYARNASAHQRNQAPEPQGVKQLLQVAPCTLLA